MGVEDLVIHAGRISRTDIRISVKLSEHEQFIIKSIYFEGTMGNGVEKEILGENTGISRFGCLRKGHLQS